MKYVLDIVEYVWNHSKRERAFKGWSKDQLALAFRDGFRDKLASWSEDNEGKINGVVLAKFTEDGKLHIVGILCDERQVLKSFIDKYREYYDGTQLTATRRGKAVVYPENFVNRLYDN